MISVGKLPAVEERRYALSARVRGWLLTAMVLSAAIFVLGLFLAPQRVWGGYLMGFVFFVSLALAGPVFLSFLSLSGARWWVALQRVPEAMSRALPVGALLGVGLYFGIHSLYEWSHGTVVQADELLQRKASWLNTTGFMLRLVVAFAIWIFGSRRLLQLSQRVEHGDPEAIAKRNRAAAMFLALFAISFSIVSFDWLMSLEPHWFSTMFALLQFAALCSVGVACAVILVLVLEKRGALHGVVNEEHLHDLGRLLFASTLFWAYCWFCQYMLIWYTNIPEETTHYLARQEGSWWLLVRTTLLLQWAVPFFALLSRRGCRSRSVLGRVAVMVLLGNALGLFVQVGPPILGNEVSLGVWEMGPMVGILALFFWVVLHALAKQSPFPAQHPHLAESLSYQTP